MSIAEMKLAAINEISKLEDANAVKEILEHLAKISSLAKDIFAVRKGARLNNTH